MADRLGDMLLAQGVLDAQQLGKAVNVQNAKRVPLGEAIISLGFADEGTVWRALAKQQKLPFVDLEADLAKGGRIKPALLELVPEEVVAEHHVLPVAVRGDKLVLAVDDPLKTYTLDALQFVLNRDLAAALATPSALRRAIAHYYEVAPEGAAADVEEAVAAGEESGDDAPVVRLVSRMIATAVENRVSDIHVEPMEGRVRIRFRKDGVLADVASHEEELLGPLVSRLKIMADMDISEKRKPQDGRMNVTVRGRPIDIRASVLPSNHGESMVMRLLDKERGLVSLDELGLDADDYARFEKIIKQPNGIVLVTGPTGSGKTTTLYAALKTINRPDVKIITAEDPVEYELPGINQVQVHGRIGLSFARILRAMLRQAPNVILVGEIRDQETAEVAIQAALTGHLVFSTLHTNDAPSALTRLTDMGVKPFLVSASIQAVLAQRLVRRLCTACRVEVQPGESELRAVGLDASRIAGRTLYREEGCGDCGYTGYSGRVGVYEILVLDGALRDLIFRNEPATVIREHAERTGRMSSLRADGVRKVLKGVTTISEVLRIVSEVA